MLKYCLRFHFTHPTVALRIITCCKGQFTCNHVYFADSYVYFAIRRKINKNPCLSELFLVSFHYAANFVVIACSENTNPQWTGSYLVRWYQIRIQNLWITKIFAILWKCLLFLFKSGLTKNIQSILLLWSNACGVNLSSLEIKKHVYRPMCRCTSWWNGQNDIEMASLCVTWTSYSLKSPVIRLFDYQLMWTHTKETWKSALLAFCEGNSPVTGEFRTKVPAVANAEKASIWRRSSWRDLNS